MHCRQVRFAPGGGAVTGETTKDAVNDRRMADEMPLAELLAEDFRTHERNPISPGFWALAVHRLGARVDRVERPF